MKAEERKELQTNSLARFVRRLKNNFKKGPSRRTTIVWSLILLAVVLFIGWKFFSNLADKRNSARWLALDQAGSTADLDALIEANKGTTQAHVARLLLARQDLKDGLTDLYTQRKDAEDKLNRAAATYEDLVKPFKNTPILVQECLLGAGKAREGLGEWDRALGFYNDLKKRFPESTLAKDAEGRARDIEKNRGDLDLINAEIKKRGGSTSSAKKD
jgi:hypothetical protein